MSYPPYGDESRTCPTAQQAVLYAQATPTSTLIGVSPAPGLSDRTICHELPSYRSTSVRVGLRLNAPTAKHAVVKTHVTPAREPPDGLGALTMLQDPIHVDEGSKVIFCKHLDLVHFVRGAEPIKEMQEWNACF